MTVKRYLRIAVLAVAAQLPVLVATPLLAESVSAHNVVQIRQNIVQDARRYLGVRYVWGGNGPNGIDCSGLVCRVYQDVASRRLPRTTQTEFARGTPISPGTIQPGDLVFFNTEGYVSHVGIYIGHDEFIHAASAGPDTGVIISSFAEAYYRERFVGARRFLPAEPSVVAGADSSSPALNSAQATPVSAQAILPAGNLAAAFSGKFVMSFGTMTLRVSDAEGNVQGTFVSSGNAGWMMGKIDRQSGTLRADWVIPETATNYRTAGVIVFKPSADGHRLVGSWRYDGQKSWHQTWIAVAAGS